MARARQRSDWDRDLGRRLRSGRWGQRRAERLLKGKVLLDLSGAAASTSGFEVTQLLAVVRNSAQWRDRPGPYPNVGNRLPELG